MQIARTLSELRTACASLRAAHGGLTFVPTMGALHDGHRALVKAAVASGAPAVASIFVNPLQFSATDDLSRYPRDEAGDLAALDASGCSCVWLPDVETIYPPGEATTIVLTGPAERWEGDARPGHFRGVATVCAKLFGHVRPDRAYFGEKDWQQLQVIQRMVSDLLLPLEIVGIETIRDPDGLALSSRNRFLGAADRAVAPVLNRVLRETARALVAGSPAEPCLTAARQTLSDSGFGVDYFALVDGPSLAPIAASTPTARLIATARLGSIRLLDNVAVL